eukprot:10279989-Alexandrium_andersonii.AAC.1
MHTPSAGWCSARSVRFPSCSAPSINSGLGVEAISGPVQLKVRAPEASLHDPLATGCNNYGSEKLIGQSREGA